jgi:hypothetical protein
MRPATQCAALAPGLQGVCGNPLLLPAQGKNKKRSLTKKIKKYGY